MTFTVKNDPDSEKVIQWSLSIDGDGDVSLTANDVYILYVSAGDGKVHRYSTFEPDVPLQFNGDGHIELAN